MKRFLASLSILGLVLAPFSVFASLPTDQPDDSVVWVSGNSGTAYDMGTGLNGTVDSVQLSIQGVAPFGHFGHAYAGINCFTDAGHTVPCGATWGDGAGNLYSDNNGASPQSLTDGSAPTRMDFDFTGSQDAGHRTFVATDYYELNILINTGFSATWGDNAIGSGGTPYRVFTGSGGTPPDTSTRIISFTPEEGTTTPSAVPVLFSIHAYINPADLGNVIGVKLLYHNIDQNVLLGDLSSFVDPNDFFIFEGQATTSGDFYYSTTTLLADGNYRVNAQLTRTYVFGLLENPFSPINQDLNHQFIVASSTFIGHISQSSFSEINSIFASSTATSTSALAGTCNPLGSFSATSCLAFLFIPDAGQLNDTVSQAKSAIFQRAPWGYFSRFYTILTGSATSSLPTISTHIFEGTDVNSGDGLTWTIDPGEMLAGGAGLINTMTSRSGHTLREALEPILLVVIGMVVIRQIVADLTKSFEHHNGPAERSRRPT